jgi:UDP-glucose 4-epimerase
LVTGISGKLGRLVARALLESGHDVVGLDRRAWVGAPSGLKMYESDIRKRAAEEVFRGEDLDAVVHMATVTHITKQSEDRFRINLGGTRAVFEHSHTYGVKRVLFVGRHTYYGAAADSPLYHTEDEPPMALETFPELADLVAADLYAGSALWRFPEVDTAVLRFCYTLGPERHGTLAAFLSGSRVPTVLGFDPLFQFMHERDVARAISVALGKKLRGVFNVCGPQPLPLSVVIREVGRTAIPVPEAVFRFAVGRFGLPSLPRGALQHVKYPVVVDGDAFRRATGFAHEHDEYETLREFAEAAPIG